VKATERRGRARRKRDAAGTRLSGLLGVPEDASGIVVFAHGSGSSRHSPRNQMVARYLQEKGLGTLLFDLLTAEEERIDAVSGALRFDIDFLAERLVAATRWLMRLGGPARPLGYFGSSTGAAAALIAASRIPDSIQAVVSRGGRPDLAGGALRHVEAPTMLIVGGNDPQVLHLNRQALEQLQCEKSLVVVPGATHLFEEPGALEEVARHAGQWLTVHLGRTRETL
jgi:putative phosphoribosyl transferase